MKFRNIYEKSGSFHIDPVEKSASVPLFLDVLSKREKKEKGHREHKDPKKVKDYFRPLAEATEEANRRLKTKNLPYRFCIYRVNYAVMINFLTLDSDGKIISSVTREITNDDFNKWVHDVADIEGLLIDTVA